MKAAAIEAKLAVLRAERDAISWADRVRLVPDLLGESSPARALSPAATELLRLLATDPKWEVRKAVTDHLHKLGESDFATFAAILTCDDNAFVQAAAERALSRRRKGHTGAAKRIRGLDRMEDELQKVEARHGAKVATLIRDMAHRLFEGLVGASVHEMRSVVTAMKVNVEHLARATDSESASVAAKVSPRLAKSVTYLERLLDDMREYTRVPKREHSTERLAHLVKEAMDMVKAEFQAVGRDASPITVTSEISNDLVASVSRDQMVLALRNLLKNAHESRMNDDAQFGSCAIRVTAGVDDDSVWIAIADDGAGLSPGELEHVRQFIPGRSSKGNLGTGFGLPIARRNIRANGGDLRIESQEDQGTTVTVWLPVNGRQKE